MRQPSRHASPEAPRPASREASRPASREAPRPASREAPRPASPRAPWIGVGGVVVAFCVLGALHLLTVAPFLPADETPHTGYAVVVANGSLPTLDTPTPLLPGMPTHFPERLQVYTANHPPLFYWLAAVPLRLGIGAGRPIAGFYAARLLSLALSAIGIVAVAALARLLVPDRPAVAVSAAGLAAGIPPFQQIAALVHNDGLAFAAASATIAASALVLVRGPSARRIAVLAVLAAAAALTRATNLPVSALAALAAGAAALVHSGRPPARRLAAGVAACGAVGLATLAASGWFYLRNLRLYGDVTGVAHSRVIFGQLPRGTLAEFLTFDWLVEVHDLLWGRLAGVQQLATGGAAVTYRALTLVILAGAALAAARAAVRAAHRRARQAPAPASASTTARVPAARDPAVRGRALAWALALAVPALLYVSLIGFFADGGGLHARYLYPGLAGLAVGGAAALSALPGGRRGLPAIAVLGVHLGMASSFWVTWVARVDRSHRAVLAEIARALARTGLPATPVLAVAAALLVAGFAAAAWSIRRLGGPRVARPLAVAPDQAAPPSLRPEPSGAAAG